MRNLFVTGGAGYLGRALLGRIAKTQPDVGCTVFSRDHGKHARCQKEFPQFRYIIGDVRDRNSVELAMAGHDTVVHAAAFKYVPEAEINAIECHEINVIGSLNVVRAAIRNGIDRVVAISTDKACQPINVYGMTKLMMERIFQEADAKSETQFNLVRYGNVVSSTGSAIPLFKRQAKEKKLVFVTNPEMTRFWLTVEEAVDLIIMALDEPEGGTVLIPRLPSLNMLDVARTAATIAMGGKLDGVRFQAVGIRFGEKIHEDLLGDAECPYAEEVTDKVMRLYPMTSVPKNKIKGKYSSSTPDNHLDENRAMAMIQEAPE